MTDVPERAEAEVLAAAERFAREVVAAQAPAWELERRFPADAFEAAAGAGLTGLLLPSAEGGRALSCSAMARVMEALAAADMAFAFSMEVHENLMTSIARFGTAEQRRAYLPALLRGEKVGAFLLTEPQGGSDAAAIRTRARRDGDGWVLDGAKAWVTNAAGAGTLSVYAQTDPAEGWRGIACFLVDAEREGVRREGPYAMLGGHAMGTGGFTFEGVRVPEAALLIPPGEGFKAAMAGIDLARVNVAAMCCGMLRAGLDAAVAHARERHAFGRPIAEFQGLRWQLADVATDLHAARLATFDATAAIDRDGEARVAAAHAKKLATRTALVGLAACMQALGADGLKHEHPLARHLACAKIAAYLDGTTEIQNVVIARALFGDGA